MAFQLVLDNTSVNGQVYPEAYAEIDFIRVLPVNSYPTVCWYATVDARRAGEYPVLSREFTMDTSAITDGIYASAYAYLKTLPEFADAIEVPDV